MTLAETLESLLPTGTERRFGELQLSRSDSGEFVAFHRNNRGMTEDLREIASHTDLRELAKFDSKEEYRPLKTAPNLKCGWVTRSPDSENFLKKLDAIYPGVFATWVAYDLGEHDPTPLRSTLERQTGMYKFAGSITDQMANEIMRETCGKGCLRQIAWPIDDRCPVSRLTGSPRVIPVICTEACTFAVSEARRLVKEAYEKENAP
ncbi:MAG: DR2241 family protein [Verrucomicrobiales bacterium]|nr:DR2241 family protein [Verrucomicrobiales bacterium]